MSCINLKLIIVSVDIFLFINVFLIIAFLMSDILTHAIIHLDNGFYFVYINFLRCRFSKIQKRVFINYLHRNIVILN